MVNIIIFIEKSIEEGYLDITKFLYNNEIPDLYACFNR